MGVWVALYPLQYLVLPGFLCFMLVYLEASDMIPPKLKGSHQQQGV